MKTTITFDTEKHLDAADQRDLIWALEVTLEDELEINDERIEIRDLKIVYEK